MNGPQLPAAKQQLQKKKNTLEEETWRFKLQNDIISSHHHPLKASFQGNWSGLRSIRKQKEIMRRKVDQSHKEKGIEKLKA